MRCRICGHDVPGIPSLAEGQYSCARCGAPVAPITLESATTPKSASTADEDTSKAGTASTAAQRPPIYDSWEIDEQLRHFRRVLGPGSLPRGKLGKPAAQLNYRLDAGHGVPTPHVKQSRRLSRKRERVAAAPKEHAPGDRPLAVVAWLTLLLGTTGFVSGLALMGWSMNTDHQDLWAIGAPTILAGQIVLILGLVLQLDRTWRDGRWAAAKLETVDEQLQDLKASSRLRGTMHASSGEFYSHWVGGAGPEILLGDLKSQLDLLAVKLSS